MVKLFSKPLQKNDKIGKSELVATTGLAEDDRNDKKKSTSRVPLWSQMARRASHANEPVEENQDMNIFSAPTRSSTRPVRTTRSSLPKYDLDDGLEKPRVEKFSEVIGLGPPWSK